MNFYSMVLTLHLLSVITWMVMLIYVPKLFVYHQMETSSPIKENLLIQANNLYKIGTAGMISAIFFGLVLLYLNPYLLQSGGWLHVKLTLAFGLVVYHVTCKKWIQTLTIQEKTINMSALRVFRIVPEILTTAIIALTLIKPF